MGTFMDNGKKNRERFLELATKRVNRVIKDLRLVGNLSNRSNYSYTADEAKKVVKAIESEVISLRRRFSIDNDNEIEFKL